MLTILEQLSAVQLTPSVVNAHAKKVSAQRRADEVLSALTDLGSAKIAHIANALGGDYAYNSVKRYLRALAQEGKVTSWRSGNTTWYKPKEVV